MRIAEVYFAWLSLVPLCAGFSASVGNAFVGKYVPDTSGITDMALQDAAAKIQHVNVPVPKSVSNTEEVEISYIKWEPENVGKDVEKPGIPLLLVHGFDSSCLEYRRLGPKLAALGVETYAVDLLGWGYTQLEGVESFSADAKVQALKGFWKTVGNGQDVCIAGASLGGAAAIEFATCEDSPVAGAIMIDAQGFVDGVGPMAMLPKPLAQAGVQVLKSVPLRSSANQMSYFNPEKFATEDALKIGRLHCLRDGWSDALVSFMLSGGFSPSSKVSQIEVPSLVMWGREDGILEGKEFANKFVEELPNAELRWIEECGHVPHLEQSEEAAKVIRDFLCEKFPVAKSEETSPAVILGALAAAAATAGGAAMVFT